MTTPPQNPNGPGGLPGPPPRRRKSGKRIALAVGATVVLGVGGQIALHSMGAGKPKDQLSVPPSLDKGRYILTQNTSSSANGNLDRDRNAPGMHAMTAVGGSYREAPHATAHKILDFDGDYGTVNAPARAIRGMLTWMQDSGEGDTAGPTKKITPAGSAEPVTCEVVKSISASDKPVFLPLCAWADSRTVGAVAETDYGNLATSPGSVDLDAFARQVNTIRSEVRVQHH